MTLSWKSLSAIVLVVVALFLLAAAPAVQADEKPGFTTVDDSTELIAYLAIDSGAVHSDANRLERLPESPGGVVAILNFEKVTDNAKAVQFGGAAGLAAFGIRGPTTI